jgi:hypothetical protein
MVESRTFNPETKVRYLPDPPSLGGKMKHKIIKFKLGDIVKLNDSWSNRIGLVKADDKAWYVIKNHWDIAGCIVKTSDVAKVIYPNAVPRKYLKYC